MHQQGTSGNVLTSNQIFNTLLCLGFDTKKASIGNREEESEFGLQRAETGDRRLQQNNDANTQGNDLRAAHSSDFFSGQRDRGRDESQQTQTTRIAGRQSFRRATSPRAPSTTTTQQPTTFPPQPTYQQYETSKRKLVRKRPVYPTSPAPQTTFAQNTPQFQEQSQTFQEPQTQNYNRRPTQSQNRQTPTTTPYVPPQFKEYKDEYVEVSRVTPKPNRYYPANPTPLPSSHATSPVQYNNNNKKDSLIELYNYDAQSTPGLSTKQDKYKVKNSFTVTDVPQEDFARLRPNNKNGFNNNNLNNQNNVNNNNLNNQNHFNNNNLNNNNNFNNNFKNNNNNFNDASKTPTTTFDYNTPARTTTNTPYKNFNSVSYEQNKNNFVSYSKQNYNPTTNPTTTTFYTTYRPDPPQNLNTVAYDTNNGFHSQSNFAEPSSEDDGKYRPPQGEDDGQYRPELYGDRELLSGAHSLNIAASGNRLPEDQKQKSFAKTKAPAKFVSQTAAPRPFRPAPTTTAQTTRAPEPTYTTTVAPQTQRTFDVFQTYTTTFRPTDFTGGAPDFVPINNGPVSRPTTTPPKVTETRPPRPQPRLAHAPTFPPNPAPRPTNQPPFTKPANKKEDNSYDYAYYDSDPGFSEYDQIEEFGRTKKRT